LLHDSIKPKAKIKNTYFGAFVAYKPITKSQIQAKPNNLVGVRAVLVFEMKFLGFLKFM
jgi:hypothetical protein